MRDGPGPPLRELLRMISDEYRTIGEPGHAQTRVLGSRFLGSAFSVESEEALDQFLIAERKQYHDATHWCFASRFGLEPSVTELASDAGEPKGTAGQPILREIHARELTNTLVIVTRYFGGTKLGTGNLARAYAECASQALGNAQFARRHVTRLLRVICPYELQNLVFHVAQRYSAAVEPLASPEGAAFLLRVRASASEALSSALTDETRGRANIEVEVS